MSRAPFPEAFYTMTSREQLHYLQNREKIDAQARADANRLVETVTKDRTGREISTFTGPKSCWMDQFKAPRHLMLRINKHADGLKVSDFQGV